MGVLVGALIISGISYALWNTTKEQTSINKISSGCLKLEVTEGTSIDIANAYQTPDSEGLKQDGYNFTINNNCNHEEYVEVNLDIKKNNTLDAKNIRATLLYKDNKIIEPNNLNNLLDRETTNKDYNIGKHLTTVRINANKSKTLNLKIWLDENTSFNELQQNNTFESKIEIDSIKRENILASDYVRIISEENNQLAYDETIDNNLRYIGKDPNNYVDFNGEKWRVIGVMNNIDDGTGKKESRVKLIRAESLPGAYSWDYKQPGVGSSISNNGSNDWSDSQLMMMLNPVDIVEAGWKATGKNYTIDNEGYVLDNNKVKIYKGVGSYYNGTNGYKPAQTTPSKFTEESVDFSTKGLTTESKNLIDKAKYNLGGPNNTADSEYYYRTLTAVQYYKTERSKNVYIGRPTEWTGYIGLMYPSDYGFGTSGDESIIAPSQDNIKGRAACLLEPLYKWGTGQTGSQDDWHGCRGNSWLDDHGNHQWFISPDAGLAYDVMYLCNDGSVCDFYANSNYNQVRPVLYLKSDVKILGGNGSKENAFKLSL